MKAFLYFFLCCSAFLFFNSCSSVDENEAVKFSLTYLNDIEEKENSTSITKKEFSQLESPNIGFRNGIHWFKIKLNKKANNKPLVFDLSESNIQNVEIFQHNKSVSYTRLDDTYFTMLLDKIDTDAPYYLRVLFYNEVYFPFKIKSYSNTQLTEKYSFFSVGMYYGFVLIALILNIFFYFSLKDEIFIYYCLFLLSIAIGFLAYDGLIQNFMPEFMARYTSVFTHFLITLFGFIFGYKFLDTTYYLPESNKLGLSLISIAVLFYLLFIPTKEYLYVAIADTVSFFALLHNWIVGILIFKKHKFAKFFVIGYSLVLFSAALFIIPIDWGINMYTTSLSSIRFGSLFEILILTYAITYRMQILQKEHSKFREEISNYLLTIQNTQNESPTEKQDEISVDEKIKNEIEKYNLSAREADVLLLISKGLTNKRIGEDLFISLNTVKYHIRNIYEKLNISSKNEAIDIFADINKVQLP